MSEAPEDYPIVVDGISPVGRTRELRVGTRGGKIALWIRPPESPNGYTIEVDRNALLDAIRRASAKH
jgi:hypothetical protein